MMECTITAVFGPIPLNPTDISLAFVFVVFYAYYFVFRFRYSTATADGGGGGPDSREPFSGDGGLRCVGPRRSPYRNFLNPTFSALEFTAPSEHKSA